MRFGTSQNRSVKLPRHLDGLPVWEHHAGSANGLDHLPALGQDTRRFPVRLKVERDQGRHEELSPIVDKGGYEPLISEACDRLVHCVHTQHPGFECDLSGSHEAMLEFAHAGDRDTLKDQLFSCRDIHARADTINARLKDAAAFVLVSWQPCHLPGQLFGCVDDTPARSNRHQLAERHRRVLGRPNPQCTLASRRGLGGFFGASKQRIDRFWIMAEIGLPIGGSHPLNVFT